MSTKYVKGERKEAYLAQVGRSPTEMKIPLMNINGNFMNVDSIITLAGVSVGGEESNIPNAEKQKVANGIPIIKATGLAISPPRRNMPTDNGTIDISIPKTKDAIMSPSRIVLNDTGAETNRSSVFILVSEGAITGPTEVAVKKTVMPTIPGIRNSIGRSLPIENAKNRKSGKRMPNISTGPLKK